MALSQKTEGVVEHGPIASVSLSFRQGPEGAPHDYHAVEDIERNTARA